MDFEISDDGTLIRYSGAGGDVVIPEGVKFIEHGVVFDNEMKITSLTLPKSLIGRKFEIDYRNGFVYNAQDNSVSNCFVNMRLKEQEANHENLYSYLYLPLLRNLERYIVHPENPIYESVDGVLLSKCHRFVIDIPCQMSRLVTLHEGFEKVLRASDGVEKEVDAVKYIGTALSAGQLDEMAMLCKSDMVLFAPNLTQCEMCKLHGRWNKRKRNIVAITPELSLSEELVDSLGLGLLLGYCFKHQIYNEEVAEQYIDMLLRNEVELYNWAVEGSSAAVQKFYKEEWAKNRLPKIDISTSSGFKQYLFEVILRGSVQDLQALLAIDPKVLREHIKVQERYIDVFNFAIALTIRYGGIEKLRAILEVADKEYRRCKSLPLHLNHYGYDLWVTGDHILYQGKENSALAFTKDFEVRSLAPIDEHERLKCLELLSDRGILNIKCDRASNLLCFFALLCGDFKIADYMISHGANMQTLISEKKEYLVKIEFYQWIHHASFHCLPGVAKLIELSSTEEKRFSMPLNIINLFMQKEPDEFAKIFNLLNLKTKDIVDLFRVSLSRSYSQVVHAIITSNQIRSKQTLTKLLDLATKYNAHEATAMLLERQQESKSKTKTKKTSSRSSLKL